MLQFYPDFQPSLSGLQHSERKTKSYKSQWAKNTKFKATGVTEVCRVGKKEPAQKKRVLTAFPGIIGKY